MDTTKTLTSQSDIGMTYYPDFTMNVEIVVAGGKNLMESGNKMEIDVLADIIEKKVNYHLRPSTHMNDLFDVSFLSSFCENYCFLQS